MKWIGGCLVILACSLYSFGLVHLDRVQESQLRQLIRALQWMEGELSTRMWPLPMLFRKISELMDGELAVLFLEYAGELDRNAFPDPESCMEYVLRKHLKICEPCMRCVRELALSMGRYDLQGQLREIAIVRAQTQQILEQHCHGQNERLCCYKTLGICAGAALAILLL